MRICPNGGAQCFLGCTTAAGCDFFTDRSATAHRRTNVSELEWRGKPLAELSREELIELVGVLHDMVWQSAENFEALLRKQWQPRGTA